MGTLGSDHMPQVPFLGKRHRLHSWGQMGTLGPGHSQRIPHKCHRLNSWDHRSRGWRWGQARSQCHRCQSLRPAGLMIQSCASAVRSLSGSGHIRRQKRHSSHAHSFPSVRHRGRSRHGRIFRRAEVVVSTRSCDSRARHRWFFWGARSIQRAEPR